MWKPPPLREFDDRNQGRQVQNRATLNRVTISGHRDATSRIDPTNITQRLEDEIERLNIADDAVEALQQRHIDWQMNRFDPVFQEVKVIIERQRSINFGSLFHEYIADAMMARRGLRKIFGMQR
jgi:hypothetical protein